MTTETTGAHDEAQIRGLLQDWAKATRNGKDDEF
jgi:hypothetical protein